MRRPTFLEGALVGAVLAVAAAALFAVIDATHGPTAALRLTVTAVAGGYVVFLLGRTATPAGRFATFALWMSGATMALALAPTPGFFLAAHAAMIWLVRALYFHSGVLPALLDAALTVAALGALAWAAGETRSVPLSAWCFFLVQALFAAIPQNLAANGPAPDDGDDFRRARAAALRAVRRIVS